MLGVADRLALRVASRNRCFSRPLIAQQPGLVAEVPGRRSHRSSGLRRVPLAVPLRHKPAAEPSRGTRSFHDPLEDPFEASVQSCCFTTTSRRRETSRLRGEQASWLGER